MAELIDGCTCLGGEHYKIMADNYYNSVSFSEWLRNERRMLIGGTMQRKSTTPLVYIGAAKRPKPTIANPKGTLKIAENLESNVYIYSWMDSSLVYFIDPIFGPGRTANITRRQGADHVVFLVPFFIVIYNMYMHAVDVFDQIRKYFGIDLSNATKKYTVRIFEILFSMCLAQAYNIYRHVHKNDPLRQLSHDRFKAYVVNGFVNHPIVRQVRIDDETHFGDHELLQYPPGSRDATRRFQGCCRNCPNKDPLTGKRKFDRTTTYFCNKCKVCLHPECFTTYHRDLVQNGEMAPTRPLSPRA